MSQFQTFYARCPYHKRRCKCSERRKAALGATSPDEIKILESREVRLAKRFIASLEVVSTEKLSSTLVPARIGHSKDVDNAILAIIQAKNIARVGGPVGSIYYQRSLNALQRACQTTKVTEETLIIATQCSLYEIITMPGKVPVFRHAEGIAAIFRSRPPHERQQFDYARTLFYESWFMVLYHPMFQGVPSAFDDDQPWSSILPSQRLMPRQETAALRYLSQALFIKLPRLMAQTRACEATDRDPASTTGEAIELAQSLLIIRDVEAEEKLLSTAVTRKPTESADFSWVVPNSYTFALYADMAAVVYYWVARLILLRLCSVLAARSHPTLLSGFPTLRTIYAERERVLMHLLRSLDFHRTLSPFAQSPYFLAVPPLHGAIIESEQLSTAEKFRLGQALVSCWQNMTRGVIPAYHDSVLKMISKVMIGGPLPDAEPDD